MCGIVGFVDFKRELSPEKSQEIIGAMADALAERGPDAHGSIVDPSVGICLGHRRLSIVDLSSEGHQPMQSNNGRYTIVFNGEIYNFLELRRDLNLLGYRFRGHSDTEVLLAAIQFWGLLKSVRKLVGMYSFALWDRQDETLHLVRDRMGEKPLYYGWMSGTFLFGSQLKALVRHPNFRKRVDPDALATYLRHNYIPAPSSIYKGVYKLLPGTILSINLQGRSTTSNPVPYWSLVEAAKHGVDNPFEGTPQEAVQELEHLLYQAVKGQLLADVPVGAFLSGGIDSSTVVAIMRSQSERVTKTFSIGFFDDKYNEAHYAKRVAQYLGTEHVELYIKEDNALQAVKELPHIYDEPFSDSSQLPTFLVSRLARNYVTVSLSGDGGDELFSGYSRYDIVPRLWSRLAWLPSPIRNVGRHVTYQVGRLRDGEGSWWNILSEYLQIENFEEFYRRFVSHWKEPEALVIGGNENRTILSDKIDWLQRSNLKEKMMYLDQMTYLPDDILTKVDRASMAVSLESRVPLLDHRIVEFSWRIPMRLKVRDGKSKWLLRQVLYNHVPRSLFDRPKKGFSVPIGQWLRGPLRDWAEELLDPSRLRDRGFLREKMIVERWEEHLKGARNWQHYLWDILMFEAWCDVNL